MKLFVCVTGLNGNIQVIEAKMSQWNLNIESTDEVDQIVVGGLKN